MPDPLDFLDSSPKEQTADPLNFLGKDISKTQSLLSAPIKGFIRGGKRVNLLNPSTYLPSFKAQEEKMLQEALPTREGGTEDILEFTGELIPDLITGGRGGIVKRSLQAVAGGTAKAAAKKAELPEWAQDIIGGLGTTIPGATKAVVSKTLRPSKAQSAVTQFLREKGFTDKEITPIIQDKKKLAWLSKGAMKYEEKAPWLKGIQDKLGGLYEDIRVQGQTGNFLQGEPLREFENKFHNIATNLPKRHRRLIEKEIEELFNNPIDFTSLHDFNIAVNDVIKAAKGGKASIGKLKSTTHDAQKALNPALFNELRTTDEVYSKLMNYTDKMTTKNWDSLIKLGQAGHFLYGLLTLNPAALKMAGIAATGRYGLRQLLSNPRLQNIHRKLWEAFLKNKMPQALKLAEVLKDEITKSSISEKSEAP